MPAVQRSALVMHSAATMFDLVNNVDDYPKFVPDCRSSKVIEQSQNQMTAALEVAKGGISKWFTTKNTLELNKKVTMELVDGPFKKLKGVWLFEALDDNACKVSLNLEFDFSNKLIELAFGRVFSHMANNMVSAFIKRANEISNA